jgi:hypothetical protein
MTKKKTSATAGRSAASWIPTKDRLDELLEEALIDAYGESEQRGGFFAKLEDELQLPFDTEVLGLMVSVEGIDLTTSDEIVASCRRGEYRQAISILDLPLPTPPPVGAEWIEAYRCWARRQ